MLVVLALALALGAQPAQLDTVTLSVGSVLRGTIVQDAPGGNVVIVLQSGESWTIPRSTIASVEYAPGRARAPAEAPPPGEPTPVPPPPPPVPGAPPPGEVPTGEPAAPAPQGTATGAEEERHLPFLTFGVSTGLAVPVGKLDASGLNLGATVSPMLTFGFEVGIRPVALLEVGVLTVIGIGTAFGPLNDLCIEAGASCDAANLFLGPYVRLSPIPLADVSPWLMASGGWELLNLRNSYEDSIELSGWLLGGSVGVDIRLGTFMLSFFAGAHLGEYGSVSTRGYIPEISIAPALHGWIDTGIRAAGGF